MNGYRLDLVVKFLEVHTCIFLIFKVEQNEKELYKYTDRTTKQIVDILTATDQTMGNLFYGCSVFVKYWIFRDAFAYIRLDYEKITN